MPLSVSGKGGVVKELYVPNPQGMENSGHVEKADAKTKLYWYLQFFFQFNGDNDITTL